MAGLEELRKKLQPLLFNDAADKDGVSTRVPFPEDTCDSYVVIMLTILYIYLHASYGTMLYYHTLRLALLLQMKFFKFSLQGMLLSGVS
jgi:hypothetical protein